jgi:transcription antitermination protein NusB
MLSIQHLPDYNARQYGMLEIFHPPSKKIGTFCGIIGPTLSFLARAASRPWKGTFVSAKNNHLARVYALQALYELDMTQHEIGEAMGALLDGQEIPDEVRQFAYTLVHGVRDNLRHLDKQITYYAPEFPVYQLAIVDRNTLRLAIFELIIHRQTPAAVVIDEAVELAKQFGAEASSRFVNGVLRAVFEDLLDDAEEQEQ